MVQVMQSSGTNRSKIGFMIAQAKKLSLFADAVEMHVVGSTLGEVQRSLKSSARLVRFSA